MLLSTKRKVSVNKQIVGLQSNDCGMGSTFVIIMAAFTAHSVYPMPIHG